MSIAKLTIISDGHRRNVTADTLFADNFHFRTVQSDNTFAPYLCWFPMYCLLLVLACYLG